ncbi:MAG: hypothetical protein ABIK99_02560 [candidate division WOR-3 bacterium]
MLFSIGFWVCFLLTFASNPFLDFGTWEIVISQETKTETPISTKDITLLAKEVLKDCFYDSEQTVRDLLISNPKVERRFNFLNLIPSSSERGQLSDGTKIIDFRIPIKGNILSLLAPKTGGGIPLGPIACPICGQPWPEGKEIPEGITPVLLEEVGAPKYTGVIIDARNLELKPCLFLRILDEEGREVYGPSFVEREELIEKGMVEYQKSINLAYGSERAGNAPIFIPALRVTGKHRCNLVISNSDARKLHSSSLGLKALRRCRVIILVGE